MSAGIDQAPRAGPIPLGVGPAQHPGLERRWLPGGQRLRPARAGAVGQPLRPLGVVADHRVPEGLPLHAGQPRRFRSRYAIERVGDRQEAHGGAAIRLAPRQAAKLIDRRTGLGGWRARAWRRSSPRPSRHPFGPRATRGSELQCAGITGFWLRSLGDVLHIALVVRHADRELATCYAWATAPALLLAGLAGQELGAPGAYLAVLGSSVLTLALLARSLPAAWRCR